MEIRVCPECNKAFYAPYESNTVVCPHCAFMLLDRRKKERLSKVVHFEFFLNGKKIPARVQDYSNNGLKVLYRGRILQTDTVIDIEIKDLRIRRAAKTVWSARESKTICSAGLKLL